MTRGFQSGFTVTSPSTESESRWVLRDPFTWEGVAGSVTVPAGFYTDGTTTPQVLWWWIPPMDARLTRASIIHDYLYACLLAGTPHRLAPTRRAADGLLYEAARDAGMSWFDAHLLYLGVRLFGRAHTQFRPAKAQPLA